MEDKKQTENVPGNSRSRSVPCKNSDRFDSGSNAILNSDLSGVQNKRKHEQSRPEESINSNQNRHLRNFNSVPYVTQFGQFQNQYAIPVQHAYYPFIHNNLVYCNLPPAVVQPNLSYACFHRPHSSNGRQDDTNTNDGAKIQVGNYRLWEKMSSSSNTKKGFQFSVMTYNVLAQDLINFHPYLYISHDKRNLRWDFRWNNLLNEIKQFTPEILCLQEVQSTHLTEYFSQLNSLGYEGIYKQRTGVRTDGCAIYYKKDLVRLIEHTSVEYYQPQVPILDRDNVAIIAKFAPQKHPTMQFVVATTHLLYNPKRQDVRVAQTQLLLTEVDRIAFSAKKNNSDLYYPVIVTGDLNSTPDSAVYQFITKGQLNYENLALRSLTRCIKGPLTGKEFLPQHLKITDGCQHADLLLKRENQESVSRSEELDLIEIKHSERQNGASKNEKKHYANGLFSSGTLSHKFALKSVYTHAINGDPEGTTFQDEWVTVDYIFYSETSSLGNLTLLERYKIPSRSQLGKIKLPNENLGSDHLSLIAKFKLDV